MPCDIGNLLCSVVLGKHAVAFLGGREGWVPSIQQLSGFYFVLPMQYVKQQQSELCIKSRLQHGLGCIEGL